MNNEQQSAGKNGPLKQLDLKQPSFTANGKEYFIEAGMSIERYCEFQILEKELGYNMSFDKMYENLKGLYKMLNKTEFANSVVLVNQMLTGVSKIRENEPTVLKMCALFINEKEEDRTIFNQDIYTRKIEDWKREGIAMNDFFALALNLVPGLSAHYKQAIHTISENQTGLSEANV